MPGMDGEKQKSRGAEPRAGEQGQDGAYEAGVG